MTGSQGDVDGRQQTNSMKNNSRDVTTSLRRPVCCDTIVHLVEIRHLSRTNSKAGFWQNDVSHGHYMLREEEMYDCELKAAS